jgi:hypothetical protein
MVTSVDQVTIRPYFNAGMLVVRPHINVLNNWSKSFVRHFDDQDFTVLYQQNSLYKIFFHQAALAGVVLSTVGMDELYELPYLINYPLHLHADYPSHLKVEFLNDLVSCRYDTAFQDDRWRAGIRIKEPLKKWLSKQVSTIS